MRFTLAQIEAFYWTVRLGTVREAAERLFVTQPSLSLRLRELERILGVKLFSKVGRNIQPTPQGRALLQRAEQVLRLQDVVRRVPAADHVVEYAAQLARASRPKEAEAPDFVREMVAWGAGPRAGIYLVLASKARAILKGRYHATTEDVRAVAHPVLRHRVITTFNAEAAGIGSDEVVSMLIEQFQPKAELEV